MTELAAIRAALLARPGEACDRLAVALREAGADVVLVGDPRSLDPDALRDCAPQAVLVALEPAMEDDLERFDATLHDPALTVIYDEADLAARREGWDAARWGRHLRAKLHGHGDVLPAGSGAASDAGLDESVAAMLASEADADAGPTAADTPVVLDDSPLELEWTAADDTGPSGVTGVELVGADDLLGDADDGAPGEAIIAAPLALDWSADRSDDAADDSISITGLSLVDTDDLLRETSAAPGADALALDADVQAMLDSLPADIDEAGIKDSAGAAPPSPLDADMPAMLDERDDSAAAGAASGLDATLADTPLEAPPRVAAPVFDLDGLSLDAMDDGEGITGAAAPGVERATPDFSRFDIGLSLADADDAAAPLGSAAPLADAPGAAKAMDLDALDRRASVLALVESAEDAAEVVELHGAVVVDAGVGGPDAVRQLLGGLPADFPRPVLVRLALDGGRYDRLAKQMERASPLRVAIAQAGAALMAGSVYFLPDGIGLARRADGFAFVSAGNTDPADGGWIDALPAADSALLLLSGSDDRRVDHALRLAADGALVAGQSPEDCYDSRASGALIARGADSGTPAQLAERLVARWPA